jgi:hypothetical protein
VYTLMTGVPPSTDDLNRMKLEWEVREAAAQYSENREKARRESRTWWVAPIAWSIPIAAGLLTTLLTLNAQHRSDEYKQLQDAYTHAKQDLVGGTPGIRASAAVALIEVANRLNDERVTDEATQLLEQQLLTENDIRVLNNLVISVGSHVKTTDDLLQENGEAKRTFFNAIGQLEGLLSLTRHGMTVTDHDPTIINLLLAARTPREAHRSVSGDPLRFIPENGAGLKLLGFQIALNSGLSPAQAAAQIPQEKQAVVQEYDHLIATSEAICDVLGHSEPLSVWRRSLSGVLLVQGDLKNPNLEGVNLRHAYIGVNIAGTDLSYADLTGADLREATIEGNFLSHRGPTRFVGADVDFAHFPSLSFLEGKKRNDEAIRNGYLPVQLPDFRGVPWWRMSEPVYSQSVWEHRYPDKAAVVATCRRLRSERKLAIDECSLRQPR